MLLRIASAYRTAPTKALLVIAKTPPTILKTEEREKTEKSTKKEEIELIKQETLNKWQKEWETYEGWTKTLIPDVRQWYRRKNEADYYITQGLTGHGTFSTYLHRIGQKDDDKCWFCGDKDSAEHTILYCPKYTDTRKKAEEECKTNINTGNIGYLLTENDNTSEIVLRMIRTIMRHKVEYGLGKFNS